ncbi:MAG: response regulator [Gemmobacter sp.]|nr:response regulator [Gemmobacter sp.]
MPDGGFVLSFTDVTAERAALEALSRANETLEARVMGRTLELEDALADAERANASRSRFVAAASHDLLQPLSAAKLFIGSISGEGLEPGGTRSRGWSKAQNALMSVEGHSGCAAGHLEAGIRARLAVSVGPVQLGRLLADPGRGIRADGRGEGFAAGGHALFGHGEIGSGLSAAHPAEPDRQCDPLYRPGPGAGRRAAGAAAWCGWRSGTPGRASREDAQNDIFSEFHRLNARASACEGMGLGLAIVERACALLGHPLGLTSEVGRGTCFMVQVPLSEGADTPLRAETPDRLRGPVAADKIAFLVENDVELRRALGLLLEKWGMTVLEAASGEEALALIEEIGILPDIFIVDHQLGDGMTGIEALAALRAAHGPVPSRLITADRGAAVQDLAVACAAHRYPT